MPTSPPNRRKPCLRRFWNQPELVECWWLPYKRSTRELWGAPFLPPVVYRALHRQGWCKVVPRPRHTKASEEAREAFKKDSRQPVHNAVRGTAVPGVLDLAAVLPLIMDALDQGSLAQQH